MYHSDRSCEIKDGTSKRTSYGKIAQEIKELLEMSGRVQRIFA